MASRRVRIERLHLRLAGASSAEAHAIATALAAHLRDGLAAAPAASSAAEIGALRVRVADAGASPAQRGAGAAVRVVAALATGPRRIGR